MLTMRESLAFTCAAGIALASVGCGGAEPSALRALANPFVYNGSAPFALPVQAVGSEGQQLPSDIHAVSDATDIVAVRGRELLCLRAGDARVTAIAGSARTTVTVKCRPLASFAPPLQAVELVLGHDPVPIEPTAFDSTGGRVTDLRFAAVPEDTSIAHVVAGRVVPRRLGATNIRLDFGGIVGTLMVEVVEPLVRDSARVAAGEYAHWKLGPGRYVASFDEGAETSAAPAASWRSVNANCASDARSRATMHCVVDDSGSIILLARHRMAAAVRIDRRAR